MRLTRPGGTLQCPLQSNGRYLMIYLKSCKRCTGDRTLERDMYGWYIMCLNCGHVAYPEVPTREKARVDEVRHPA